MRSALFREFIASAWRLVATGAVPAKHALECAWRCPRRARGEVGGR
jgi:hypothetical protein